MKKKTKKTNDLKKIIFFGFVTLGFFILCSLGTWQVFRLNEKQELIAQIEEGFKKEPVAFSSLKDGEDLSYRRVVLKGQFIPNADFTLLNKKNEDEMGDEAVGVFKTDNKFVVTNLDWISKDEKSTMPSSKQEFVGYFTPFPKRHAFRPEHKQGDKNILWIEKEFLEREVDEDLFDWVFFVTANRNPDYDTHHSLNINLPNNHRQYAFFWYSMAIILVVMGGLVWRSRGKK